LPAIRLRLPGTPAASLAGSQTVVLKLGGWSEPPALPRRAGTPGRGLDLADLDLPPTLETHG